MGYELHITRREEWSDEKSENDIALCEWLQYVSKDPEMRLDNFAQADLPDGTILRNEKEGIAVWERYSGNGIDQNQAWFTFYDGCIDVKNPDQEIINKMVEIAQALDAKVQGDEGELYEKEGSLNSSLKPVQVNQNRIARPWRKFW